MTAVGLPQAGAVVTLTGAAIRFGRRTLWSGLDLTVRPGEFITVLGANGSGKSSLLRAIMDPDLLSAGAVDTGTNGIGYIPQRTALDDVTPVRVRDLVRLGLDGHRWGLARARGARAAVGDLLRQVNVAHLANTPVAQLSGGELQRVRIAEALAGRPTLLLADEPLAALDLAQASQVVAVIDDYRRRENAAVLFITHDINAVLEVTDRVLYLAGGGFRLGAPDEVLTTEGLTELYGAPVDVFRTGDRIVVVAATDPGADHQEPHDHPAEDCEDPHGRGHLYTAGEV